IVAGILSGVHEPGTSHHALLGAFASPELLARAHAHAVATDLHIHEFGDSTLVLPGIAQAFALAA
ncbi:MAG TPA: S-adenosylmethionine:tRNA ribosyltransferase-isomerase, partial [Nannocystaceae bacterium]|nr:S-adenosylmethionine:tRNA ribosyltransferase-isomerase [Nannocystaceae bacterium]